MIPAHLPGPTYLLLAFTIYGIVVLVFQCGSVCTGDEGHIEQVSVYTSFMCVWYLPPPSLPVGMQVC